MMSHLDDFDTHSAEEYYRDAGFGDPDTQWDDDAPPAMDLSRDPQETRYDGPMGIFTGMDEGVSPASVVPPASPDDIVF